MLTPEIAIFGTEKQLFFRLLFQILLPLHHDNRLRAYWQHPCEHRYASIPVPLEAAGKIIRLKKGLYVLDPKVSHVALSTELIANQLYTPSYVSMQTALRYYGLIPEAVYTTQSMTLKHTRRFDTPVGRFEYQRVAREAFPIGITSINKQSYAFLMATPEKALCDLIAHSPKLYLRYLKDVETYLEDDLRMDIEDFLHMDASIFERYAQADGKKANSIETLIKYLKK